MSGGISKECFPPATTCHNCDSKDRHENLEKPGGRKELKRCNGCHLLTYCDRDCQTEHWQKVHKRHCKFLSGRDRVQNSQHRRENCSLCLEEGRAKTSDITSKMSPKTDCHVEALVALMKESLGAIFRFHEGNKLHKCSVEFGCQLPFALGEVSGSYVGNGLDEMVAHALKIINAMLVKDRNEHLEELGSFFIRFRVTLWTFILQYGVEANQDDRSTIEGLTKILQKVQSHYGASSPWWKALLFSVNMILEMNSQLCSKLIDRSNLDDPKMSNGFKQVVNFHLTQLNIQEIVTKNNLWPVFKLWPVKENGELRLLLPNGARCQNCKSPVSGQFAVKGFRVLIKPTNLPVLMCKVGENGQLVVACPSRRCLKETLSKDVTYSVISNEVVNKNVMEDQKIFFAKAWLCDFCRKKSFSSHRCSECKASQYCSAQCQQEDLNFHKTVCSAWAKDKLRKIGDGKHQQMKNKSFLVKSFE